MCFSLKRLLRLENRGRGGAELRNLTDGGMGSACKNNSASKVAGNTWTAECIISETSLLGLGPS